jgi:hypothetical protein
VFDYSDLQVMNFFANYHSDSAAVTSAVVYVDGKKYEMTLDSGTSKMGTYISSNFVAGSKYSKVKFFS